MMHILWAWVRIWLRAELAEAKGDLQMLRGQLAGKAQGNVAKGAFEIYAENETLRQRCEAAEKDARRYRLLRKGWMSDLYCVRPDVGIMSGNPLDAAIDAALAAAVQS